MQVAGKRVRRKRCGKFRRGKRNKGDKIDGFFFKKCLSLKNFGHDISKILHVNIP